MALDQCNRSSQWRGPRAANASPVPATPSQASPSRFGQWRQNYERYKGLAESAGNADAVMRESYWQHAEHFIRLINEAAAAQAAR
jgi:Domain of unknown function (DUF4167)